MEIVENLQQQILNGRHEFNDCTIIITSVGLIFTKKSFNHLTNLSFNNCLLKGSDFELNGISQVKLGLRFADCTFECNLIISDCDFSTLGFKDIREFKSLEIQEGSYNYFYLKNTSKISDLEINGKIDIDSIFVTKTVLIENITHTGNFEYSLRNRKTEKSHHLTSFKNSTFKNLNCHDSYFGEVANFNNLVVFNSLKFETCDFEKSSFIKMQLAGEAIFDNCKFYSNSIFNYTKAQNIKFQSSLFETFSHFNFSNINTFVINHTSFDKKASFDGLVVDSISLYQTTFNQGAFFDELKIKKITDSKFLKSWTQDIARQWRRTLRQIKQELQKAENKIDYNRFRAYELSAYYQELNWKWKGDFKDKFILWATNHVTGFDHSWRKALRFTLIASLFFYSLFFITENYMHQFDLEYYREFLSGSFRFLLVTDFYNPLSNGREYIHSTNTIGWFIFILGKIVIAFGIYEMIQAFRKFKA